MATFKQLASEIDRLDSLIKSAQHEIELHQRRIKKYQKALDLINNKQGELLILESQHKAVKDEAEEKKEILKDKLSKVIDIELILKSISIMSRTIRTRRAPAKSDFWDAQRVIEDAVIQLRKVNLVSKGLDKLALMNYNRPDRDFPSSVGLDEIFNLTEIKTEGEE